MKEQYSESYQIWKKLPRPANEKLSDEGKDKKEVQLKGDWRYKCFMEGYKQWKCWYIFKVF